MMNIIGNANIIDDFYRYKRPEFIISVIGKGNKLRTIISNLDEICIALNRTSKEIIKFYCYELGTSYKFIDNNHTLKGQFNKLILNEILHKYIQIFILCNDCSLPDTFYKFKKTKIKKICSACGHSEILPPEQRLVEHILKDYKKFNYNMNNQNYN